MQILMTRGQPHGLRFQSHAKPPTFITMGSAPDRLVMNMANQYNVVREEQALYVEVPHMRAQLNANFGYPSRTVLDRLEGDRVPRHTLADLLRRGNENSLLAALQVFWGGGSASRGSIVDRGYQRRLRDMGLGSLEQFQTQIRRSIGDRLKLASQQGAYGVTKINEPLTGPRREIERLRQLLAKLGSHTAFVAPPKGNRDAAKMWARNQYEPIDTFVQCLTTATPRRRIPPLASRPCAHVKGAKA